MYVYFALFASFKTRTGPACHAGPTRQSEIKGVLSVCKGASAKMPTPQLEILHLPGKDRNIFLGNVAVFRGKVDGNNSNLFSRYLNS